MTTLNLDSKDLFGSEGSGAQKKSWTDEGLVKLDSKYKESDKEVYAARIAEVLGISHADYTLYEVSIDGHSYKACFTPSFLKDGESEITMRKIMEYYDFVPSDQMDTIKYFDCCVELVWDFVSDNEYLGLTHGDIRTHFLQMVAFDYLICNEDRHLSNFSVLIDDTSSTVRMAPLFDHGRSFLKRQYLTAVQLQAELRKFKSKPFSRDPDKNIISFEFANALINNSSLSEFLRYDNSYYAAVIRARIQRIQEKCSKAQKTNLFGSSGG